MMRKTGSAPSRLQMFNHITSFLNFSGYSLIPSTTYLHVYASVCRGWKLFYLLISLKPLSGLSSNSVWVEESGRESAHWWPILFISRKSMEVIKDWKGLDVLV